MLPEERPVIEKELKILAIIHVTLMSGIFVFALAITIIDVLRKGPPVPPQPMPVFQILVPLFGLIMIFLSSFLYKKMVASIPSDSPLSEKLASYRSFNLIHYAMLEGAALFAMVVFFLTKDLLSFAVAGVLLVAFFIIRPNTDKCITELHL